MRTQKENSMLKHLLGPVITFVVVIAVAGSCRAQQSTLVVNVPFTFHADDQVLAVGEYSIGSERTGAGVLHTIRDKEGHVFVVVSRIAVDQKRGHSDAKLIFHRYGDLYFLAQIWSGDGNGRKFSESAEEKKAASRASRVELALTAHK
jgi:hypothetical protein